MTKIDSFMKKVERGEDYWLRLVIDGELQWHICHYPKEGPRRMRLLRTGEEFPVYQSLIKEGIFLAKGPFKGNIPIVSIHPIPTPGASRDWLWCDKELRRKMLRGLMSERIDSLKINEEEK